MALKRVTETCPLSWSERRPFGVGDSRMWQCVGGRGDCVEADGVTQGGAVTGADLGGSSNYSNVNFED